MTDSMESKADSAEQVSEPTENVADSAEQVSEPKSKKGGTGKRAIRLGVIIGAAFIIGFIVFGVVAILVWDYSNSVAFCANACHDVHPEEIHAFEDSYHSNIRCTECHMGRVGTLNNIVLKASHARHLPEVIFDAYERPLESATMRPANESCELCHFPPAFHGDTVREITRFQPDDANTQNDTYLIMKTGAGEQEMGGGFDIHWHVSNPVEYIAADAHNHEIPWVRTTLPDGRTVEYSDVTNSLTPEEIQAAETTTMDCVDCHNRVGHPFPPPEDLVDQALAEGRLDPRIPNAKGLMMGLITAPYESRDEAIEAIEARKQSYIAENPDIAAEYGPQIEEAADLAKELAGELLFDEPGVSWADFPDHNKHKDFPGCFRCHDGKHMTDDGESIRLQCNICHNIPATVDGEDLPPEVRLGRVPEPEFHHESNFIADHRFQADESCEQCHGPIEFGADDSSFCANSSCHGRSWPAVDLDAAFPHPIELEGAHAEAWCHDCHNGVREPSYECANCHEAPQPHFGDACEDCHTPLGFEGADMGDFEHPVPLEGAHASAGCSDCHAEGREITGACADCHEPPEPHFGTNCEDCHTPTSFADADMPAELHPVALEGAHATASCDGCHVEGQETPEFVCSSCHEPPDDHYGTACEDCHTPTSFADASLPADMHPVALEGAHAAASCDGCHVEGQEMPEFVCSNCHEVPDNHLSGECETCHKPEGFASSAAFLVNQAPEIDHDLSGRDNCMQCHDPEGQIKPAPSNHVEYENEQCILCHKAES